MRIAALYDIHGNLPALEAVLEEVKQSNVDRVVVGGDVVPGPMPPETLALLLALDVPVDFVMGNGDREVLMQMQGQAAGLVPEFLRPMIQWVATQLTPDDERRITAWHKTLTVDTGVYGDVLFCHATPRNDTEIFTRLTPDERLIPVFEGVTAPLVVCGHTHMQTDRMIGNTRVVNAGSVGMPYAAPGAYWLLLDKDGVHFRHTEYDVHAAAERILATEYPMAEDYAESNVVNPPSEAEALDVFTKAQL